MQLDLTPWNILFLLTYMSPLYVTFFMIMGSFFNQNVKAFVWLGGVALFALVCLAIQHMIGNRIGEDTNPVCVAFKLPGNWSQFNVPSISSYFIAFTLAYLVLPMISDQSWNYFIIIGFAGLLIADAVVKLHGRCTTYQGVLFGSILGFLFGQTWYSIIKASGGSKLLYTQVGASNSVVCSKPKKQQFKCHVYKNGQLVGSSSG